jgi:LemA protein
MLGGYGAYIFLALIIGAAFWAVGIYNNLVRSRQQVEEGWSGVDVQLRRRANLIPNLVETVKTYAGHEKDTLNDITMLRRQSEAAESSGDTGARAAAEGKMSGSLMHLFAVAENYPDLKANQNFLDLQNDLTEIEEQIQLARRYFNGSVRNLNVLVESVPSNFVAMTFNFEKAVYFEVADDNERTVPKIDFGSSS